MKKTPQAITKAITKAISTTTLETTQPTSGVNSRLAPVTQEKTGKAIPPVIATQTATFGTFSFTFTIGQDGTLSYDMPEAREMKQTDKKTVSYPHPNSHAPSTQKNTNTTRTRGIKTGAITATSSQTYQPRRSANSSQRFFKPPPATGEWQKVVSRNSKNHRKLKKCYYCHKEGHIQRFCWQRLKCYSCGQFGHKYARCASRSNQNNQN